LCQAVAAGEVAAGAAILPYAADAMAVAGKVKGVRPVQGTRPESVAAALRHFSANLLVLEHAFSTHHQMRTMLRQIASGARGAGEALEAALLELERS
jgi:ribose 5-phosphate isomerase RpiB